MSYVSYMSSGGSRGGARGTRPAPPPYSPYLKVRICHWWTPGLDDRGNLILRIVLNNLIEWLIGRSAREICFNPNSKGNVGYFSRPVIFQFFQISVLSPRSLKQSRELRAFPAHTLIGRNNAFPSNDLEWLGLIIVLIVSGNRHMKRRNVR